MVRFNDTNRVRWDLFVIILAVWNCFWIPFAVALEPSWGSDWEIQIFNNIIDLLFMIDIVVNLRTTFVTKNGTEIYQPKKVASKYILGGRFLLDFLSSVPISDIIPNVKSLELFGILKLVRITRLAKIIAKLDMKDDAKALVKIVMLTFYLVLYIHVVACFWFFLVNSSKLWIPPMDWINPVEVMDIYTTESIIRQYFYVLYYSTLLLISNEMGPITQIEQAFAGIIMLMGALINANIFGEMAVLIQQANRKQSQFQGKVDMSNTVMGQIKLAQLSQEQVRNFIMQTQQNQDQQEELDKFLELISPSLKLKTSQDIFQEVLRMNSVIKAILLQNETEVISPTKRFKFSWTKNVIDNNDTEKIIIASIVQHFHIKLSCPDEVLIKQDDETYEMYFIAKGDACVRVKEQQTEEIVRILKIGNHFGEISTIYGCKRTASVISGNYCTLAMLLPNDYTDIITKYPEIDDQMKNHLFKYDDKTKLLNTQVLRRVEFLSNLSDDAFHKILYQMEVQDYPKGEMIFQQGNDTNKMQVICHGVLEIYVSQQRQTYFEGEKFIIETLHKGSILNHRTFFMDNDVEVYGQALKSTSMLELTYQQVKSMSLGIPELNKMFLKYEQKIYSQSVNFPLDYIQILPIEERKHFANVEEQIKIMKRQIQTKNASKKIIEYRQLREKPRLSQLKRFFPLVTNKKALRYKILSAFDSRYLSYQRENPYEVTKRIIESMRYRMNKQTLAINKMLLRLSIVKKKKDLKDQSQ